MDEHLALYPQAPSWTSRWCRKGKHWAETAAGGDERKWMGHHCRDCQNARQRERRSDPEVHAVENAATAARMRERRSDPEYAEQQRKWKKEHYRTPKGKATRRRSTRTRRARRHNAICQHGPGCFATAAEQMPGKCAVKGCRRQHIVGDHIVPLAKGGKDCRWNLQMLCCSHNASKHAADPVEWQLRHGLPAGVQLAI